jgi:hypothetical protein
MRMITLVPTDTNVDFVGRRLIAFAFSGLLILASIGSYAVQGLNLGIDFLGGILIEIRTPEAAADIGGLRAELGGLGLGEVALQEFGQPSDVLIRVQRQEGDERAQQAAVEKVKAALGSRVEYRRTEFVGPKVGGELRTAAMWAVLSAIVAILLYIWFRFEWQFGIGAVIALVHDVITTIGLFSLFQLEFNLATVAAILTIAGYSITVQEEGTAGAVEPGDQPDAVAHLVDQLDHAARARRALRVRRRGGPRLYRGADLGRRNRHLFLDLRRGPDAALPAAAARRGERRGRGAGQGGRDGPVRPGSIGAAAGAKGIRWTSPPWSGRAARSSSAMVPDGSASPASSITGRCWCFRSARWPGRSSGSRS